MTQCMHINHIRHTPQHLLQTISPASAASFVLGGTTQQIRTPHNQIHPHPICRHSLYLTPCSPSLGTQAKLAESACSMILLLVTASSPLNAPHA